MPQIRKHGTRFAYEPDYAVPPGHTLQETIDGLGIDQRELANRAGLSAKHINQIIKGVAAITHDVAIRLERVTGVPARLWNGLESNYREQRARLDARQRLERDLNWLRDIPTKELIHRKVIKPQSDDLSLLEEVLRFFGVGDVDAWKRGWKMSRFAFRKSLTVKGKAGALATWLRLCELDAARIECEKFDKREFRKALDTIRNLTTAAPTKFVNVMTSRCAAAGVALALVPEIKGAPVSGAAKWLTPTKAMIGLNLRDKFNDRFWFTFFHECGHILNDSKKETFVDVDYADDPREQSANEFASDLLIPPSKAEQLQWLQTRASVTRFADSIGIAPGIVVGRLQREQALPYSHLNGLKVRLKWADEEASC
ncbi:MAG: helix-turn-helix domain-containing protein [Planctomycetales bacterium]